MKPTMLALSVAAGVAVGAQASDARQGPHAIVERIVVHGRSLEGNLAGDSPDRPVSVYLPPSYTAAPPRRYPVLYLLHGFTDDDNRWFGRVRHFIDVPRAVDRANAQPDSRELIVVMPNAYTRFHGSMYSRSATTGDWDTIVTKDLVDAIDARYRTVPAATARGLAGHSMGGYGTLRLAMKFPGVFSAVYGLSPCCLSPPDDVGRDVQAKQAESVRSFEDFDRADFSTMLQLACAAAWSPNPQRPPLFLDTLTRNGETQPLVVAKWRANAPLAMLDTQAESLRRLAAVAFDAGDQDTAIAATLRTFDTLLTARRIAHTFEIYQGDHVNRIGERFETRVLPFFWRHLAP